MTRSRWLSGEWPRGGGDPVAGMRSSRGQGKRDGLKKRGLLRSSVACGDARPSGEKQRDGLPGSQPSVRRNTTRQTWSCGILRLDPGDGRSEPLTERN